MYFKYEIKKASDYSHVMVGRTFYFLYLNFCPVFNLDLYVLPAATHAEIPYDTPQ